MSVRFPPGVLGMLVAFIGCMPVAAHAANTNGGKDAVSYKWTDEQGVVHYGDSIPPQYARKERSVLNSRGVEVRKLDAQKTPEQIAAEERTEQDVLKQKQHDAFLMNTYTSVKDIEALRDVRLDQLDGQRVAAQQYVDSLHSRLSALQERAKNFKPYSARPGAHRMPDDVAEDLVRTLNELRTQSNALTAKVEEQTTMRSQFQTDIERYRELRATAKN
jgi:Domain of unknown function (DUF4124)